MRKKRRRQQRKEEDMKVKGDEENGTENEGRVEGMKMKRGADQTRGEESRRKGEESR